MRSLRSWFDAVLDQPATQRQAWIDAHCPDPEIRERLHGMLAVHDQTAPLLPYYENQKKLVEVDGMGSIEDVSTGIDGALEAPSL